MIDVKLKNSVSAKRLLFTDFLMILYNTFNCDDFFLCFLGSFPSTSTTVALHEHNVYTVEQDQLYIMSLQVCIISFIMWTELPLLLKVHLF